MKRLLIVSDPPVAPGYLPRLRYLCEYLVRKGYDVTWVTEQRGDIPFDHTYPLITIPMYSGSKWDWFIKSVWTLLTDWYNRAFAKKINHQLPITNHKYDLVLCSTFNEVPLGAAKRIADQLNVPLFCDIRDLDEQVDNSRYQYHHQSGWLMPFRRIYRAVHIRRRNKVLRAATVVTTVSAWHREFIRTLNPNTITMFNGYDEKQFHPKDIPTDTFRITYIGSLFDWQKPALNKVQTIIEELNKTKIINHKSQIVLDVHTPQNNPIPYTEIGDAIRRSSIMLVLTDIHTHGMLTTKFFEALGCQKPILCVPSDQGELAELMDWSHAGLDSDDFEQIKAFIIDRYKEWQTKGFTRQSNLLWEILSREAQSEEIEKLINIYLS
ncbi:MAG: glycosyltransferase family 4 protein [Paludibacteraceae bacterium]|nr:glycosyltransferase family 4 protein [Paludibacteraceae bacterium]